MPEDMVLMLRNALTTIICQKIMVVCLPVVISLCNSSVLGRTAVLSSATANPIVGGASITNLHAHWFVVDEDRHNVDVNELWLSGNRYLLVRKSHRIIGSDACIESAKFRYSDEPSETAHTIVMGNVMYYRNHELSRVTTNKWMTYEIDATNTPFGVANRFRRIAIDTESYAPHATSHNGFGVVRQKESRRNNRKLDVTIKYDVDSGAILEEIVAAENCVVEKWHASLNAVTNCSIFDVDPSNVLNPERAADFELIKKSQGVQLVPHSTPGLFIVTGVSRASTLTHLRQGSIIGYTKAVRSQYQGVGMKLSQPDHNGNIEISHVYSNSPAYAAGIQAGDILVKVDDASVNEQTFEETISLFRNLVPGDVDLIIKRNGTYTNCKVTKSAIEL